MAIEDTVDGVHVIAPVALRCVSMTAATRDDARAMLGAFLGEDEHYRASAAVYGDGGAAALERALDLFLARPEIGFVWLAQVQDGALLRTVGACVVCNAISTSCGSLVAKLDDVSDPGRLAGPRHRAANAHRADATSARAGSRKNRLRLPSRQCGRVALLRADGFSAAR